MNEKDLLQWLFENGGPAIRYRVAKELLDPSVNIDIAQLRDDLLASPITRLWLARVGKPNEDLSSLHHSKPEAFENAVSKLCDLGLHAGIPALDEKMQSFLHWLDMQAQTIGDISEADYSDVSTKAETQLAVEQGINWFETILIVARLAWLGYDTPAIRACLLQRLDTLYTLARTGNHDIYIDQDTFGDYPNNPFRKRPLIAPQFNSILPSIHDIYALVHYPKDSLNETTQHKIDTIIAYILHSDYQAFNEGYGVMRVGPRRYFSMGWSVHLPGFSGFDTMSNGQAGYFIQRLELMSHFSVARQHTWFQESLLHLKAFRTGDGTYRFPAYYLKESSSGYWVTGAYMRLEENRRAQQSLNLDSTFRIVNVGQTFLSVS
ncbi:MAG: hypothetical protein JXA33_15460 [Anaerolineae bacterium]|nr:hypothetical protein [Anaerolineae bacterium]